MFHAVVGEVGPVQREDSKMRRLTEELQVVIFEFLLILKTNRFDRSKRFLLSKRRQPRWSAGLHFDVNRVLANLGSQLGLLAIPAQTPVAKCEEECAHDHQDKDGSNPKPH